MRSRGTYRKWVTNWRSNEIVGVIVIQDPGAAERFLREARAAVRISEPHVVRIHDCRLATLRTSERGWLRADAGAPFIVIEYMRGLDLSALMPERNAPLDNHEIRTDLREACIGLAALARTRHGVYAT